MNFILMRLRKPGYVNEEHQMWCVATGWFEGIWPDAEVAKREAEFAVGFTDCDGKLFGERRLSWTEVEPEQFEFKSYRARGYHPRRIFKAPYPRTDEEASADSATWTGLWLLFDHTEDKDP